LRFVLVLQKRLFLPLLILQFLVRTHFTRISFAQCDVRTFREV
jgi:hypothetical protein